MLGESQTTTATEETPVRLGVLEQITFTLRRQLSWASLSITAGRPLPLHSDDQGSQTFGRVCYWIGDNREWMHSIMACKTGNHHREIPRILLASWNSRNAENRLRAAADEGSRRNDLRRGSFATWPRQSGLATTKPVERFRWEASGSL